MLWIINNYAGGCIAHPLFLLELMETESSLLRHEPCPNCGSKDNLARYDDGHGYCFGCSHYEHAPKEGGELIEKPVPKPKSTLIYHGETQALGKRKISQKTCEKFGYKVASIGDTPVHVAPYKDKDGQVVAQHIRFPNKNFIWKGNKKNIQLFGQHLWGSGGKMLTITEGELDAMSMSELWDNKWPVVSISNGAAAASQDILNNLEWVCSFEKVILAFDMDEPGQKAAQVCASLMPLGKARIAHLPLKDASEMLQAGRGKELVNCIWNAKTYRPDGLVTVEDLKDELDKPQEKGLPWPWEKLSTVTYGRRRGEVYTLGAGTGIGKTDIFTQIIAQTITDLKLPVGVFFLEQNPKETIKRIAGKIDGKLYWVPDAGWSQEEYHSAIENLAESNMIHLYDHFGGTDWTIIKPNIRYLAASGVKDIFIDHLTALADPDNERTSLEKLMKEIATLAQELGVTIYLISHLATPEGKPHEEGGRVMIRHYKGSRSIGFWSHYIFALERNQQDDDPDKRKVTTFRVLKDRHTGQATGFTFPLLYNSVTGRLHEYGGELDGQPLTERELEDF